MSIKFRLIIMNFLQYFIWGSWLISLGSYVGNALHFDGVQIGSFFATMGIASLFMPGIMGIIADRWIEAQKLLGISHILGAGFLIAASFQTEYIPLYTCMLLSVMFYMPTISLSNTVAYNALEEKGLDIVKDFPPIRVWGTVGFICAMWTVDFTGFKLSAAQLYLAAGAALMLGLYAFTLPRCKIVPAVAGEQKTLVDSLGLKAFALFKEKRMAIFFIFSMLLGAALQITNSFGDLFLSSFSAIPEYANSFGVKHSVVLLSISQMSETLFILAIPFFLKKFGIKRVMLISMFAWVLRFALFGLGNPGPGLWMLILSMIVYGMAFDFFNISGSLFVEQNTNPSIRASAQGVFMIMTNGIGAVVGSYGAGMVVNHFTEIKEFSGQFFRVGDWPAAWYIFAGYALVVAIVFAIIFKYKHNPQKEVKVTH
ncbi:MAG: nucleoside permease [Bacteroides sp.]|nr:nucleoside permease [Bacteroides sp.]